MKRYETTSGILYIGECEEMKAIYKSLDRASREEKTWLAPLYLNFPVFHSDKLVGVLIHLGCFRIVQGDKLTRMITDIW